MEFTQEHKKNVEKMIVDAAIDALGAQMIPESELQPIAAFVLGKIDLIKTVEELTEFLKELTAKWSFFLPIERFLEAEVKHEGEKELIDKAEDLVKNGNVNEALEVLKSAE
ncbi:MAG: hypothetical protein ACM3IJ_01875 [Candidatus Levyibacteriota bacterium]